MRKARSVLPLIAALVLFAFAFGWIKPDILPIPPGPGPDVPNQYGVGLHAYTTAPRDGKAGEASRIYQQSTGFLYGVPSLKFITTSDPKDAGDPERDLLAWQTQQVKGLGGEWPAWYVDLTAVMDREQKAKQFTRADWRDAFAEVAKALEAVK